MDREKLIRQVRCHLRDAFLEMYELYESEGKSKNRPLQAILDAISLAGDLVEYTIPSPPEARKCVECGDVMGNVPENVTVCPACEAKPTCAMCDGDIGDTGVVCCDSNGNPFMACKGCGDNYKENCG